MNNICLRTRCLRKQKGTVAVMIVLTLLALVGFVVLAVDTGWVMTTRNELQNTADAAALAATRQLGAIYEPMTYAQQQAYVCDPAPLVASAANVANKNQAAGKSIAINAADVIVGQWDSTSQTFTPTLNQPDAVRVTARRDGNANGAVTTFFARVFGVNTFDLTASATAALTGQSTAGPGELDIPVGISKKWFEPGFCNQPIKFYPTGSMDGCAGWHTFDSWPSNASKLRGILQDMAPDPPIFQSPEVIAGQSQFVFTGGNIASVFDEMEALYDAKKDPDGTWVTNVVVYDRDDCSNPQNNITIVGFATAIITGVNGPSDDPPHTIFATVLCDNVEFGRGSGGEYGTKGSIPGLVE